MIHLLDKSKFIVHKVVISRLKSRCYEMKSRCYEISRFEMRCRNYEMRSSSYEVTKAVVIRQEVKIMR